MVGRPFFIDGNQGPFALLQGRIDRLGHAVAVPGADHDPVHHNLNIVYLETVYLHFGLDVLYFPVYAHFGIATFPNLHKQFPVVPLAPFYHRGQQDQFFSCKGSHHRIQYLVPGLAHHFFTGNIGKSLPCPGI